GGLRRRPRWGGGWRAGAPPALGGPEHRPRLPPCPPGGRARLNAARRETAEWRGSRRQQEWRVLAHSHARDHFSRRMAAVLAAHEAVVSGTSMRGVSARERLLGDRLGEAY